jgi:hypothetical protein
MHFAEGEETLVSPNVPVFWLFYTSNHLFNIECCQR